MVPLLIGGQTVRAVSFQSHPAHVHPFLLQKPLSPFSELQSLGWHDWTESFLCLSLYVCLCLGPACVKCCDDLLLLFFSPLLVSIAPVKSPPARLLNGHTLLPHCRAVFLNAVSLNLIFPGVMRGNETDLLFFLSPWYKAVWEDFVFLNKMGKHVVLSEFYLPFS